MEGQRIHAEMREAKGRRGRERMARGAWEETRSAAAATFGTKNDGER
jgi:hypothetical protein